MLIADLAVIVSPGTGTFDFAFYWLACILVITLDL